MVQEVVEKRRPVGLQPVNLEISQRERKAVVDADECRRILRKALHQPMSNALAGPIFPRARRWMYFGGRAVALCPIDPQTLEARSRRLRAGVIDADGAGEDGHPMPPP